MKNRMLGLVALIGLLGAIALPVSAQQYDPQGEFGNIDLKNNGKPVWKINFDNSFSTESLKIFSVPTSSAVVTISTNGSVGLSNVNPVGGVVLDLGNNNALGIGIFTTAEMSARTPRKIGEFIFNTTIERFCYSTGTANGGQYASVTSTGTGLNQGKNFSGCYSNSN